MSLVQIVVDENEMQQRIQSFIELKRDEINRNNLIDFIDSSFADESCARIASSVYKVNGSKGHLKIKRVKNETGPIADDGKVQNSNPETIFSGIDERLVIAEKFLQIKSTPLPKDVYQRLKAIEDRIAHLNTISPEYSRFTANTEETTPTSRLAYSIQDLDSIIDSMQRGSKGKFSSK